MSVILRNESGVAITRAADKPIRFRFTTDAVDRHGTIINPKGLETKNWSRIILWGHDGYGGFFPPDANNVMGKQVGMLELKKFKRGNKMGLGLEGDVEFASEINPHAAMVEQFVRAGIVTGVSIGFRPLEKPRIEEIEGRDVPVYDKTELLEASIVPIPANPEATTLIRGMVAAAKAEERLDQGWRYEDGSWYLRVSVRDEGASVSMTDLVTVVKSLDLPPAEAEELTAAEIGKTAARVVESWRREIGLRMAARAALRG